MEGPQPAIGSLPVELRQMILSHLDCFNFESLRLVSQDWYHAASSVSQLRQRLEWLGMHPSGNDQDLSQGSGTPSKWAEASRSLLLRARLAYQSRGTSWPLETANGAKKRACPSGTRLAVLEDRTLTLHGPYGDNANGPTVPGLRQCRLDDLRTASGPVLRNAPARLFELAVSPRSNLVVVALDRTIQIYDLDRPDASPASAFIYAAAGSFVTGLDFTSDDHLLRVRLSDKGTVLYLGATSADESIGAAATLKTWKSANGLGSVFLQSTSLVARSPTGESTESDRFTSIQLLRRRGPGWVFACQRHRASGSRDYCIAYTESKSADEGGDRATSSHYLFDVLTELPCSFPASTNTQPGFWSRRPQPTEAMPVRFAASKDGRLLAVVEESEESATSGPYSDVFMYSTSSLVSPSDIPRLPIYLGRVIGSTEALQFRSMGLGSYKFKLTTMDAVHDYTLNVEATRRALAEVAFQAEY